jgi:hypothetical protein
MLLEFADRDRGCFWSSLIGIEDYFWSSLIGIEDDFGAH